jgi:hypothetical protein
MTAMCQKMLAFYYPSLLQEPLSWLCSHAVLLYQKSPETIACNDSKSAGTQA